MSHRYSHFAVAACVATAGFAHAAARAQAPDLATIGAKTISVDVTQYGLTRSETQANLPSTIIFTATHKEQVAVERPGKVRIEARLTATTAKSGSVTSPNFVFVSDGKKQYDYVSALNQYIEADAPTTGQTLHSRTIMTAGLDFVLGFSAKFLARFTASGNDTLDGKTLALYVYQHDVKSGEKTVTHINNLWVDAATRLPVRYSHYSITDGNTTELLRCEFSNWKINASVDESVFKWTAPANATVYKAPERPTLLAVGTPAPDFATQKWGGGDLRLSNYRGKVVVLDFWATWCGPCQLSMPHAEKVYEQTKGQEIAFLGVCVWDHQADYEKWVPEHQNKYSFTFGFDPASQLESFATKQFKVSGIPVQYVIDKDGKVAAAIGGYYEGDNRLENALAKLGITLPVKTASK